jgi:hypothetical protein
VRYATWSREAFSFFSWCGIGGTHMAVCDLCWLVLFFVGSAPRSGGSAGPLPRPPGPAAESCTGPQVVPLARDSTQSDAPRLPSPTWIVASDRASSQGASLGRRVYRLLATTRVYYARLHLTHDERAVLDCYL